MQKNRKLFVILLGLVCVFSAASLLSYFGVFRSPPADDGEDNETIVSMIPIDEVTAVEWTGGATPAFRLRKDPENGWYCPEQAEVELDQAKAQNAVLALCQVVSNREITEPDDAYGLAPARRQVTLTLSDGRTVNYFLGNLNPYTNRYYFQMEQNGAIYAVGYSVGQSMDYGILDYVKPPDLPKLKSSFLDSVRLQSKEGTFVGIHNPQQYAGLYLDEVSWFSKSENGLTPVDTKLVEERLAQMDQLSFDGCVSLAPTEEELAQWGLDAPLASLEAVYRPDTASETELSIKQLIFKLRIGAENDSSQRYVQTEEGGAVYLMPAQPLRELFGLLTEDYASLLLCPIRSQRVREVRLDAAGQQRTLSLTWDGGKTLAAARVDGVTVKAKDAAAWLDRLVSLRAQEHLSVPDGEVRGKLCSIRINGDHAGDPAIQLDFYAYNASQLLVSVQGKKEFLIQYETIKGLLEEFSLEI